MSKSSGSRVFVTRSDYAADALQLMRDAGLTLIMPLQPGSISYEECLTLLHQHGGVDAIFCAPQDVVDEEIMDAAGSGLKVIATDSVGYNHIALAAAKERGIKVGYTPDAVTDATAELTVALLLATARQVVQGNRELLAGNWDWMQWTSGQGQGPSWGLGGKTLAGATVGIFGLGRIGQAVWARLRPFGISKCLYTTRTGSPKTEITDADCASFDQLLRKSDFLIVTAALTPDTLHVFDASAFARMKPDSVFINTSRGGLVDQEALVIALQTRRIGAAGLDVMTPEPLPPDHPLTTLGNCVLTPHLGTAVVEVERQMAILTARNIIAGLSGDDMPSHLTI